MTMFVCLNVSTTPLVLYVAWVELIAGEPSSVSSFVLLEVNLNVFSPFLNLTAGTGVDKGSLNKNYTWTFPTLSDINLIFETVAVAPLVLPTNFKPVLM